MFLRIVDKVRMFLLLGGTFLFHTTSLAQTVFTVKDKSSKLPIEYAQAALLRINEGSTTDVNGKFSLDNYKLSDSLNISSLGYKSESFVISSLISNPVIYLTKLPIALNEVTVSAKRKSVSFHTQRIGWMNNRVNTFINLNRVCTKKGSRIAVWIDNKENQIGIIDGVVVKLLSRQDTKDSKPILVRVCSLSGNSSNGPEQDLSNSPTIFKVQPNAQTLTIKLEKSTLYLPAKGGFVGIEWLDSETETLPICVALTNSDMSISELSNTWQSYRGKKWTRFGLGRGQDGSLRRFNNNNARIEAIVTFPDK